MDDYNSFYGLTVRPRLIFFAAKGKIKLIIDDNGSAHSIDVNLTSMKLTFLPANMTNLLKSCNQRIVQNLPFHYR